MTGRAGPTLGRLLIAIAALLPPAIGALLGAFQTHRILTVVGMIAYEIGLAALTFGFKVFGKVGDRWTDRTADIVDARLRRMFSSFERAYLRHVQAANRYVDLKGLTTRGEYTLRLDEVFVQLSIDPQVPHLLDADPWPRRRRDLAADTPSTIWTWIARASSDSRVLAIIGPPGSGKTTLLRHVALLLAKGVGEKRTQLKRRKIPVLIALRDHLREFGNKGDELPTLEALIRTGLEEILPKEPPGWIESQLTRGRLLIMLDGLDELAEQSSRMAVTAWVEKQRSRYSNTIFLVTSRPFGYRANPIDVATVVQVNPFNERQIRFFLESWYRATIERSYGRNDDSSKLAAAAGYRDLIARLEDNPALYGLAVNPLLLTMIANVHHYRGALPGSRSELYREICEVFLGKRHHARGVPIDMTASQKQVVLQFLAYEMMCRSVRDITVEDATACLAAPLARVAPDLDVSTFLRRVEESSGILLERENAIYAFAHLTFQEYLAACHIRECGLVEFLSQHIKDSWWRETIRLYSAQSDATPIVISCLEGVPKSDESESVDGANLRGVRLDLLALAVDCMDEGREIGKDARALLERVMNPPDVRINSHARIIAGLVRLLRRERQFERVSEDLRVSVAPLTNAEYQAFIDSQAIAHQSSVPDHWADGVYPEGTAEDSILGLREQDAQAFCAWMGSVYPGLTCRLPWPTERRLRLAGRALNPERFGLASYWETNPIPDLEEQARRGGEPYVHLQRLAPIEALGFDREQGGLNQAPSVFRSQSLRFPGEAIAHLLANDWHLAVSRLRSSVDANGAQKNFVSDLGTALEIGDRLDSSLILGLDEPKDLLNVLETIWTDHPLLDIGYTNALVEMAVQDCYGIPRTSDGPAPLVPIAQALGFACSISLNRSAPPHSRSTMADTRLMARLCAYAAAKLCEKYAEFTPLDEGLAEAKAHNIVAPIRRLIKGLRLWTANWDGSHKKEQETEALHMPAKQTAKVLYLILLQLILLELRISGTVAPTEGMILMRDARFSWERDFAVGRQSVSY